jgi:outer membrane protein OmpA-like peptidoglycan-associated protein
LRRLHLIVFLFCYLPRIYGQEVFTFYFDTDKDQPTTVSRNDFQQWISDKEISEITEIKGYCDARASIIYNRNLGQRRVNAVVELLCQLHYTPLESISLYNYGKEFKQDTELWMNRKVEVSLIFKTIDNIQEITTVEEPSEEELIIPEVKPTLRELFEVATRGTIIILEQIHFEFNSTVLTPNSFEQMEELLFALELYPAISIEIGGHICCNPDKKDLKLSRDRAKLVYSFLISKGIPSQRLKFEGYGSNRPIYPLPEKSQEEKAKNRRVEITVL